MKGPSYIILIFIAGILQVCIFDHLRIFGTKPDLLLACVVLVSLSCPGLWAIGLSILAGAFKDIFSAGNIAANTLLFPVWSVLIIRLNRKIRIENDYMRMGLSFFAVLFHGLVSGLTSAYTQKPIAAGHLSRISFWTALYTAAVIPFLFKIEDLRWGDLRSHCLRFYHSFAAKIKSKFPKQHLQK